MNTARSYDAIADFYDDDMGRNADGGDVVFYRNRCRALAVEPAHRVLELGCGTGRITLALAESGIPVIGVDLSLPMLRVLRRKALRLAASAAVAPPLLAGMDMARPAIRGCFAAVLCPFSAFTYLLEDDERRAALAFMRRVLSREGRLLMDVFVPDPAIARRGEIFDYRRKLPDGTWLERHKTITAQERPGVNHIRRRYTFLAGDGSPQREIVTDSWQRPCGVEELTSLLREAGFGIASLAGDFSDGAVGPQSRVVVVEAEPAGGRPEFR